MPTNTLSARISDLLLWEASPYFSRDTVTIKSGGNFEDGTVLALETATGKYVQLAPAGSGGTNVAAVVVLEAVDASAADKPGVVVARVAALASAKLVWPAGITDPQKATALGQLAAAQIIARATI
jgi:hypothetical protein